MKKFAFLVLFATLVASFGTSRAQTKKSDKVIVEEIVAVVGNESISLSELYTATQYILEGRKAYGVTSKLTPAEEAFEELMKLKLMYVQAKLDSLDKDLRPVDEDVQKKIDEMVRNIGSIKALENATGKAIFQLREDIKQEIIESNLSQLMEYDVTGKVSVTHREVEAFFKTLNLDSLPIMPPTLSFAQIVKLPPVTDERKFEVRQKLLEFRERIMNGEKMSVLARLYSHDDSRYNGGEYNSTFEATTSPYAEMVRQMKPGQISEIVETEFGYHIIELLSKTETDFISRHILLKPEFTIEEEAKATKDLDSIANLIRTGQMTFDEAVKRHSDDLETKMNGGLNFNTTAYRGNMKEASTRFMFDQLSQFDSKVLIKMNVGDVSTPYQSMDLKGNMIFKIVTITELIPAHQVSLAEDFVIIENAALNNKQNEVLQKWIDDTIGRTYIYINEAYMDYNFVREGWKKQSEKYTNQ